MTDLLTVQQVARQLQVSARKVMPSVKRVASNVTPLKKREG